MPPIAITMRADLLSGHTADGGSASAFDGVSQIGSTVWPTLSPHVYSSVSARWAEQGRYAVRSSRFQVYAFGAEASEHLGVPR